MDMHRKDWSDTIGCEMDLTREEDNRKDSDMQR